MAFVGVLAAGSLLVPSFALAAPSDDDIARAKAEEQAAQMSVSQIEVELANVTANFERLTQEAQIAGEAYNAALMKEQQAKDTADKAQADADAAQADYEKGKRELASVVQTAYRSGGSSLDSLTPYLESDGLRSVETKQAGISSFGSAAEKKMQRVAALEQVAQVMQEAADKALALQQKATEESQNALDSAKNAASQAEQARKDTEVRRDALVQVLAEKRNTTADLIRQQQEENERRRREAAAAEARQRAAEQAARDAAAAADDEDDWSDNSGGGGGGGYTPPVVVDNSPGNTDAAAGAIAYAKQLLGSPYVWAGEGPGYDCSGLVTVAYRSQGIYLEHYSVSQYAYGASGGSYVSLDNAQPGDLVFWSSNGSQSGVYHVAIYLGGNQIIEAPTFGVPVRITSLYGWGNLMPYAVRVV